MAPTLRPSFVPRVSPFVPPRSPRVPSLHTCGRRRRWRRNSFYGRRRWRRGHRSRGGRRRALASRDERQCGRNQNRSNECGHRSPHAIL